MSAQSEAAQAYCNANGHQFIGPVGEGAFKETFHIILNNGEPKALKIYLPGYPPERTTRELSAMQRCSHPHIARLSEIAGFYHEGEQYLLITEEFLAGGTLTTRLTHGLLPKEETLRLGCQLVSAVAHIASHGLVHRDIKPDNILFREDGVTPVIVDFGLVRDLVRTSLTASWFIRGPGTPFFAPPEQLRNEKHLIDWRSDQFSLGVVLGLATFGLHPYAEEGSTLEGTVERVAERLPQSIQFKQTCAGAGLPLLTPMTASWPVERFRTPEQLERAWQEVSR